MDLFDLVNMIVEPLLAVMTWILKRASTPRPEVFNFDDLLPPEDRP